jgi:uroporphyrin-III C-methyltransferase
LPPSPGTLYLIGAGPGDPELLTLKAARIIGECDVLLYDRLIGPGVLKFAKPAAELIYVGKREGEQEQTQRQIFQMILHFANAGKSIGRLKGGDPMVFGRGGEEWALATSHGIPTVLIPGISSAIGVPGIAGIPLTYRLVSDAFAVVTAHHQQGEASDWQKYAAIDTLVILMGVKNRVFIAQSLITAGRPHDDAVAFIERGSLPSQRIVESVLSEVAAGRVDVRSPAVFVIGPVVKRKGLGGELAREGGTR